MCSQIRRRRIRSDGLRWILAVGGGARAQSRLWCSTGCSLLALLQLKKTVWGRGAGCQSGREALLEGDAGADADLLSLFNKDAQVSLFSKNFDLFKKCFGSSAARRTYTGRAERSALLSKRAGLSCPASSLEKALSITKTKVSSKK